MTSPADRPDDDTPAHWQAVRRALNTHRYELAALASRRYPATPRVASTPLLCRQEWIPDRPLDLDEVQAQLGRPRPAARRQRHRTRICPRPASQHSRGTLPGLRRRARCHRRHRPCSRTASATGSWPPTWPTAASSMGLGRARYFDGVSIGEAIAHELAQAWLADPAVSPASCLPLRELVGDPCDLSRHTAIPAITTLTLRRGRPGEASFLLHWRDPAKVTHAGGMYQAMPVGIFQPVDDTPASERNDLSLWKCMAREFSEELLGTTEDYSALGTPVDYGRWDFYQSLTAARQAGKLNVACLGIGVDPLSLAVDILTVAVFDGDTFDAAFGGLVTANAEGRVVSEHDATGIPFTREAVTRFAEGGEPMQAAGAAVLNLAWRHRAVLLS